MTGKGEKNFVHADGLRGLQMATTVLLMELCYNRTASDVRDVDVSAETLLTIWECVLADIYIYIYIYILAEAGEKEKAQHHEPQVTATGSVFILWYAKPLDFGHRTVCRS